MIIGFKGIQLFGLVITTRKAFQESLELQLTVEEIKEAIKKSK